MAPVTVDGIPLFRVRGVTSFPAESRARLISERVVEVARDPAIAPDAVNVVPGEAALRIVAADRTIMFVADADAVIEGVTPAVLATTHAIRLRQAIGDYRTARARPALLLARAANARRDRAAAAALLMVAWLWRRLDAVLQRRVQARIQSVGIQSFEVVRADQIRSRWTTSGAAFATIIYVVAVLVYASYVLALWPWTRGLSRGAAGLVVDPLIDARQRARGQHPADRIPHRPLRDDPPDAARHPPVLRSGRER